MQRLIKNVITSRATSDGAGVKLQRAITPSVANIDPFLMLDEISSDQGQDYIAGFPDHPHRGFETVTYMLQGKMRHKDHLGNEGVLEDGAVQWMTAGRGVIHSEMPEQTEGLLHGFQLWINLPAKDKMQPAAYQEYASDDFPIVNISASSSIKVMAGTLIQGDNKVTGPVKNIATEAQYFDIRLSQDDVVAIPTKTTHTVLLYCFKGQLEIAGKVLAQGQTAVLSPGDLLSIKALEDAAFLFLSAQPIGEPVVNYGPFVMNTAAEIEQAIQDYHHGCLTG
ncbi:MAG: pirin family protein [Pseudomonadales bacterium]|nr:pirin family protein [Pseudomonadales bacterium]